MAAAVVVVVVLHVIFNLMFFFFIYIYMIHIFYIYIFIFATISRNFLSFKITQEIKCSIDPINTYWKIQLNETYLLWTMIVEP